MAVIGLGIGVAVGAEMLVVEKGISKVPIMVASDASEATTEAVQDLVTYIEKISGAKAQVLVEGLAPFPENAIWIGAHPNLDKVFPGANLAFTYPEEILHLCNGQNILIAGRDRIVGTNQIEYGTANSIYTFIEKQLDVRWLWPSELGEDIIKRETIAFAPFEFRFHPIFRFRRLWPRQPRVWHRRQRLLLYSYEFSAGHAYTDWWVKYHEAHPEWFALRADGTRMPETWGKKGEAAKLCVSNPEVAAQWLTNAEKAFRENPSRIMASASPNDGGGFCVCENCTAMDHPAGATKDWPYMSLTDRYVKYWNVLARGLRERFPDREAIVGGYAYSAYKAPPIAAMLEANIAVGYVGSFPTANDEVTQAQKQDWLAWAAKASALVYRPNLFYYSGGYIGLPTLPTRRTIEDMRFLAENKCVGFEVDSLPGSWATQGLEFYLMAQLAYDPLQDGEAIIKDYCRRGFGPAAAEIEQYFRFMEQAHEAILLQIKHSGGAAREMIGVCQSVYTPALLAQAEALMLQAEAKVAAGPELYIQRVAFSRTGLSYVRLQAEIMTAMKLVRESRGADAAAVKLATELCAAREALLKQAPSYAINSARWFHEARRLEDYMGPPSEELISRQTIEAVRLRPAEWTLAFSDDFQRTELGPDWDVKTGKWTVGGGELTASGEGIIRLTHAFPGLQKVEFEATVTPNPGVSDVTPFIQSGTNGLYEGYLMRFGGNYNKDSGVLRKGEVMEASERVIEPNKTHKIVVENDGAQVRLTVDGDVVAAFTEDYPLIGDGHDRIGFYKFEGILKIRNLKVFTSPAVKIEKVVIGEGEGFD